MLKSCFNAARLAVALDMMVYFAAGTVSPAVAAQARDAAVVEGVVRDGQGNTLAGAQIVLTDNATGISRTVRSNSSGAFRATGVPPRGYAITVTLRGFETVRYDRVQLIAGAVARIDAQLGPH